MGILYSLKLEKMKTEFGSNVSCLNSVRRSCRPLKKLLMRSLFFFILAKFFVLFKKYFFSKKSLRPQAAGKSQMKFLFTFLIFVLNIFVFFDVIQVIYVKKVMIAFAFYVCLLLFFEDILKALNAPNFVHDITLAFLLGIIHLIPFII